VTPRGTPPKMANEMSAACKPHIALFDDAPARDNQGTLGVQVILMIPNRFPSSLFQAPLAQPLCLILLDPTYKHLKSVRASFPMLIRAAACLHPSFSSSTLLPSRSDHHAFCPTPSRPSRSFPRLLSPPSWRKEKSLQRLQS